MRELFTDLKETAPCGMEINYTVDNTSDMITHDDIYGRGIKSEKCKCCGWRAICRPRETENEIAKSNMQEIIEKMESSGMMEFAILRSWYDELRNNDFDKSYYLIYGMMRGLCAVGFITEKERQNVVDEVMNYGK